jgi:hypothetical protein
MGRGLEALMYPRSVAFDNTVVQSHVVVARADILLDNNYVTSLQITDGNVTVQDDAIRRRCNFTMQDPTGDLVPDDFNDMLTPGRTEVKLYRGIQYYDGTQELLPLGVFGVSKFRLDDSGATMSIAVDAFDRARRVQRAVLALDYVIPGNTNYIVAVQNLIRYCYPQVRFAGSATTNLLTPSTPIVLQAGKDPWGEARRLLGNVGYEAYFDPDGYCTIQAVQTSLGPADWALLEGTNATLLSLTKTLSDEQFFNHAVVTGENTNNTSGPVRAEVMDQNPRSPTYVNGPMGNIVDYYTSSDVTSTQQALNVARARLNKSIGIPIIVETQDLVHPALDIDDTLQITRLRSKINDLYSVSKITIPMTFQRAMNVSTRQRVLGV